MKGRSVTQIENMHDFSASRDLRQVVYAHGKVDEVAGSVIVETPVTLTINGEMWLSFLCTPVHLDALAVGFLYNEGVIDGLSEIESLRICPHGENVDIWLNHPVKKMQQWTRTTGCSGGITGLDAPIKKIKVFNNGGTIITEQINNMLTEFYKIQMLYKRTGGVHTSALSDGQRIVVDAEDIGRHNTLDKLAGRCLLEQLSPTRWILLTTGRISSEMLQKAARMQSPVVISRTSPSSRSVSMAESLGITLIGYARLDKFIIYTHPERIVIEPNIGEKRGTA